MSEPRIQVDSPDSGDNLNVSSGSSESDTALPATSFFLSPKKPAQPHTPIPSRRGSPEPVQTAGDMSCVRATCHCRRGTMRIPFHTQSLPLPVLFCHCNTCRHVTGQVAFSTVKAASRPFLPGTTRPLTETFLTNTLQPYRPPDQEGVTWYFCPGCSAKLLVHISTGLGNKPRHIHPATPSGQEHLIDPLKEVLEPDGIWRVSAGALQMSEGVLRAVGHICVSNTQDGGFADHLPRMHGIDLPRYSEGVGSPQVPLHWRNPAIDKPQAEELLAYCACRQIQLAIARPSYAAILPSAPYPDLIYPADTTRLSKKRNPRDEKWWLRPAFCKGEPDRYLAGYCACDYCTLTSGSPLQTWAWIPRNAIREVGEDTPISLNQAKLRPKGLKQYSSSPGRYGEFCESCGATVMWWNAGRPDLLNISVGLINQDQDGVRAEHWLDWYKDRVSFSDSSKSRKLIQGLLEGLQSK